MKAHDFIEKMLELKPNIEDFRNVEISEELISDWIKEFDVSKISSKKYNTEILTLILAYDVSSLRINDITFDSDYQEDDEYFFFGWDALPNRIAIYKPSGKIVSYDPEGDKINFLCAQNAEKFLDALYEIMKFSKEKMINLYSEEKRDERSIQIAYIAALKAGGEEYEDYYKSVLWVE